MGQRICQLYSKKNEQFLNDFKKALKRATKRPYFQNPTTQNPKNVSAETPMIFIINLRTITRLSLIKSAYLFEQGKEKEAFEQTIKMIKLGQMLQDNQDFMMSYLIDMGIKFMGLEKIRTMISKTNLSSEILKEYIIQLEQFKLNERGLENALKMEHISMINTKERAIDIYVKRPSFFYKPNQGHRIFAEHYRGFINNVDKDCYEMRLPEFKLLTLLYSEIKMLLTENIIAKILHDIILVTKDDIFKKKCEEDFSIIGTQLLLAIRAYQVETGEIPISLDKLVPKYISKIPRDPFDGEPVRFDPEKRIIYSVERNLTFEIEF
jgi:hypothetical protein